MNRIHTTGSLNRREATAWLQRVTGLSPAVTTVVWAEEHGYLRVQKPGRKRPSDYAELDLLRLALVFSLREAGATSERIRKASAELAERFNKELRDRDPAAEWSLVVMDGPGSVLGISPAGETIKISPEFASSISVVPGSRYLREARRAIRKASRG